MEADRALGAETATDVFAAKLAAIASEPGFASMDLCHFWAPLLLYGAARLLSPLIAAGAPLDAPPGALQRPLALALASGSIEKLALLLEAGADPNFELASERHSCLAYAIRFRRPDMALALLRFGADPDYVDSHGRSHLSQTLHYDDGPTLSELLARGLDPSAAPGDRSAKELATLLGASRCLSVLNAHTEARELSASLPAPRRPPPSRHRPL